jgi:membrane-associated phospholipid phosphatase
MVRGLVFATVVSLVTAPPAVTAADEAEPVFPSPLAGLGRSLADSFAGPNVAFQMLAIAETATLSTQDIDVQVRDYFHRHPRWGQAVYPVIILGVAGPVALFGGLHSVGHMRDSVETVGAAYAVLQAGALTLGYVTILKFSLGRPAPRDDYVPSLAPDMAKLSRTFRPGFDRGGVVAGWPSGHVAVTTAMAGALVGYYPDSLALKFAGAVAVAAMMLGVSSFDAGGMHWCSDALAGALMAFPIGLSTGRSMRQVVQGEKAHAPSSAWFVLPSPVPGTVGATLGRSL